MKILVAFLGFLLATGCAGSNVHGECKGFGKQDPDKTYEISTRNAVVSVIFIESIVVPVVWALEYAYCPVENKTSHVSLNP